MGLKQRKIKIEPRVKLNHSICTTRIACYDLKSMTEPKSNIFLSNTPTQYKTSMHLQKCFSYYDYCLILICRAANTTQEQSFIRKEGN